MARSERKHPIDAIWLGHLGRKVHYAKDGRRIELYWSESMITRLIQMYTAGDSNKAIADEFLVESKTIHKKINELREQGYVIEKDWELINQRKRERLSFLSKFVVKNRHSNFDIASYVESETPEQRASRVEKMKKTKSTIRSRIKASASLKKVYRNLDDEEKARRSSMSEARRDPKTGKYTKQS